MLADIPTKPKPESSHSNIKVNSLFGEFLQVHFLTLKTLTISISIHFKKDRIWSLKKRHLTGCRKTELHCRKKSLQVEKSTNAGTDAEGFFQEYKRMMSSTPNSVSYRLGKADKAKTKH